MTTAEIRRVDRCLVGSRNEARNRALLYLGLGTGMRIAELVSLTIGDVAPFGEVLDHIVLDNRTKSRRSRTVWLTPQAQRVLVDYIPPYPDTFGALETRDHQAYRERPLFGSNRRSSPLTANAAVKLLTHMFRQAGVANASSHSLRRTHANQLRRTGADLKLIQEQLGHASLSTTERYFDVDPLEKQAALAKVRF